MVDIANNQCGTIIFPVNVDGKTSFTFTKKMFATSLSHVAFLRGMLPEESFLTTTLEGIPLKILKESGSPNGTKLFKWILGCFDAIDKRYLKLVTLGVSIDPQNQDIVSESYIFRFEYTDKDSANIGPDPERMKTETTAMFRNLCTACASMAPLPEKFFITMKLQYFDDVTPNKYEPPGFQSGDGVLFKPAFTHPVNVRFGTFRTNLHNFKVSVQVDKNTFLTMNVKPTVTPPHPTQLETADAPVENVVQRKEEGKREENDVRCPCGVNIDDGVMVLCSICNMWQHGVCFRILTEHEAPEEHVCHICGHQVKQQNTGQKITDITLLTLNESEMQSLCLLRRALLFSMSVSRFQVSQLAEALDVPLSVAQTLLNRLEAEKVLSAATNARARRFGLIVNQAYLRDVVLPKYMQIAAAKDDPKRVNDPMEISSVASQVSAELFGTSPNIRKNQKSHQSKTPIMITACR